MFFFGLFSSYFLGSESPVSLRRAICLIYLPLLISQLELLDPMPIKALNHLTHLTS